jgi:hypothetical protein
LGQALTNGAVSAVVAGLVLGVIGGLGGAVIGTLFGLVAGGALAVPTIRRRHLVVDDEGLTAYRNAYRLRAGWDDIEGFEMVRFAAVVPLDSATLRASSIERRDGTPVSTRLRNRVVKVGGNRRIQLGVFVKDRSEGRFAELLAHHRPDLAPSTSVR